MDRVQALQAKVAADPYDAASWEQLVAERKEAKRRNSESVAELRATYDELLKVFPTAAGYWRDYCELEIATNSPGAVKALFSRCLLMCLSVDLWRAYLQFIKKLNEPKGAEGIDEIRKAYEFTLDRLGQDLNSGPLWLEYAHFLQAPKVGSPVYQALFGQQPAAAGQQEGDGQELQRVVALRRAYQRAVVVPTSHVDQLWREYEQLENSGSNKTLARRVLDEWRPKYQAARLLYRERSKRAEGINFKALPLPPGRGGTVQQSQAALWQEYLEWEKGNPQRLEKAAYVARVSLTYDQALMVLLHYPDTWLEYAAWHAEGGGSGSAAANAVLGKARKALPACLAVQLAAADALESGGSVPKAKEIYEGLVEHLKPVEEGGVAAATAAAQPAGEGGEAAGAAQKPQQAPLGALALSAEQGTLAWIQYMRFSRRTENIMAARKVFMRARKYPELSWQAYVASALMEWQHDRKDQIPRNIFELGLKAFLGVPDYVEQYATFLLGLGDLPNARALFERALTDTSPEAAPQLWDAFLRFEYEVGTTAAIQSVEQRRREAVGRPTHDPLQVVLLKHKVLGLWPASGLQQQHFQRLLGLLPPLEAPPDSEQPRGRDHEHRGERAERGERDRSPRPARDRHHSPPPHRHQPQPSPQRGGGGGAGFALGGPGGEAEPIRQFPPELGAFMTQLPPPHAVEGPLPDVDLVIDVLVKADLTPDGITAHELAAARERRRQRRIAEQQQGGGGPPHAGGGPRFGGPPGGRGGGGPPYKRRAALDAFDDDESDDDEDGGDYDENGQPGLDVYRMRRKQQRS
ncbi:hypothetical protein N2152v2_004767 [Parachlorella kessleri]